MKRTLWVTVILAVLTAIGVTAISLYFKALSALWISYLVFWVVSYAVIAFTAVRSGLKDSWYVFGALYTGVSGILLSLILLVML